MRRRKKALSLTIFCQRDFHLFRTIFLGKKIFFFLINLRSSCGQTFINLAQQMNVLYSAEQKG